MDPVSITMKSHVVIFLESSNLLFKWGWERAISRHIQLIFTKLLRKTGTTERIAKKRFFTAVSKFFLLHLSRSKYPESNLLFGRRYFRCICLQILLYSFSDVIIYGRYQFLLGSLQVSYVYFLCWTVSAKWWRK